MQDVNRRAFIFGTLGVALSQPAVSQASLVDSAGRALSLDVPVSRVFAAGGPAAVAVYILKPEALVGWPRALRDEDWPYVLPSARSLPEVGQLTGRGDTANVEQVLKFKPDIIVDYGSIRETYKELADVTQTRTGIPYALIDGRLESAPVALRLLARLLGVPGRGEALARYVEAMFTKLSGVLSRVPDAQRPRVYLARGPDGLETGLRGSINTEIIERAGGRNVADPQGTRRGIARISAEQLLVWNPDIVITWDRNFFERVTNQPDPAWRAISAVENRRVHLAPTTPFGWIDRPPSLNRLIGLAWLANLFHGDLFPFDIARDTRAFYKLFYQVDVPDNNLKTLIAWADGRPPVQRGNDTPWRR